MHLLKPSPIDDTRQSDIDQGYVDAGRGHTACPFGDPQRAAWWAEGYDSYPHPERPRFGALNTKKRR